MLAIRQAACLKTWCAVGVVLVTTTAAAQQTGPPKQPADEVRALIDSLVNVDEQDTGYSASLSGSSFLPLGQSEFHVLLLFQRRPVASKALLSLTKLGAKAIPHLLTHLSDRRPTKIVIYHSPAMGFMAIEQDEDAKARGKADKEFVPETKYTVLVGDLCYVALGQIVNRNYAAVRYIPSGNLFVTSVPNHKKLRDDLTRQWGKMTPEGHRESLVRDLLETGDSAVRNGASLRLAYYYPEAFERAALKQLARPTYSFADVYDLVQTRLYAAKTAKERKALVDQFVARKGEIALEGIRWRLFDDLERHAAAEEGRHARECLVDAFGLPATVKSQDRPGVEPLSDNSQTEFVNTLHFDQSEKIDRVLRDLLAQANSEKSWAGDPDNEYLATACLDRLVGRGYDDEIETYLRRRLPQLKSERRQYLEAYRAKLGWTKLHQAVDLKLLEYVERAVKAGVPVDAQGRDGRTALHLAAGEGQAEIVQALLAVKANPRIKDRDGRLAVELAAAGDYPEIVRQLVARGAEVRDVFVAATVGDVVRLRTFVAKDASAAKARNRPGLSPLQVAAREGHLEAVRALVAAGADVKAVDEPTEKYQTSAGMTALHLAVIYGKTPVAEFLLDHGAEVNAVDKSDGATPLHYAAWAGHVDLVQLLLARKANPATKDGVGRTPLELAKDEGNTAVIRLLEK